MIGIFRKNLLINSLMMLPYIILVRINSLIEPTAHVIDGSASFVTHWIYGLMSSAMVQSVVAILLVFVQAVYINRIVIRHRVGLGSESTLIPGLIYVWLTGLIPDLGQLSPALIANTFILIMLSQIFKTYKNSRVADTLFNIGFSIGLAALLVPHYIYLLVIGLVGILILRSIKLPELLQLLTGTITIFVLLYGYRYVFTDVVDIWDHDWFPSLTFEALTIVGRQLWFMVFYLLLAVLFIVNYRLYTSKKIIQAQKKVDLLFWVLLFSGVAMFINGGMGISSLILMSIPASIFLAMNLLNIKKPMVQELIHLAILGILFLFHFVIA